MNSVRSRLLIHSLVAVALVLGAAPGAFAAGFERVTVTSETVTLRGPHARQQIGVTGWKGGRGTDLTRASHFESESPEVVTVAPSGFRRALSN